MSDVQWIKITTNIFDDEKIKLIESMPEKDTIFVIWIKLLILAGKINNGGVIYLSASVPYTEEMLSTIFGRPLNTIRLALATFKKFGMIEIKKNDFIFVNNWDKHQNIEGLEKIKEQNRIRQQKHREKQKEIEGQVSNVKSRDGNAVEENRIDKNRIDNIYIVQFEELWKQYPKAIGKKEALKHFTASVKTPEDLDNIKKALTNYSQSKRVKDGYVQNGSTWFNNWTDWINFKEVGKDKHGFISKDCDVEKTKEQLRKEGFRVAD